MESNDITPGVSTNSSGKALPLSIDGGCTNACGKALTGNKYQKLANRTAAREPVLISPRDSDLLNWTTGLTGEAGEVADLVKKGVFHGQELAEDKIRRELGDVLWYIAAFCHTLDFTMEDIMAENIEKLRKRFPDGFDTERSTFREEVDVNTKK